VKPSNWRNRHNRPPRWTHNRRFVFRWFALLFGGVALLSLLALVTAVILIVRSFQSGMSDVGIAEVLTLGICGFPFIFLIVAAVLGNLGFRRFGAPIADVMSAVDAVTDGDLSVRVNERVPGRFGRLAARFNRMIAELQRAEQQRQNMTADIAHELRNPLHIIQGNLEGMLDGVYEPTPEKLSATLDETHLLARLVEDLQTLSLAEAGQLPLHRQTLLAGDLLADVQTSFDAQAAAQGVGLVLDLPPEADALSVYADPDRLDQVLSNLVANALRHTPSGGKITLRAAKSPGGVRLQVLDTGEGIPPEDLPYIFDRFWRGDRARTRTEGGHSGLGLAIARQLVRAHGGELQAESQPGAGTTMTIDLPAAGQGE
jgi:signal transduction histidine kinase